MITCNFKPNRYPLNAAPPEDDAVTRDPVTEGDTEHEPDAEKISCDTVEHSDDDSSYALEVVQTAPENRLNSVERDGNVPVKLSVIALNHEDPQILLKQRMSSSQPRSIRSVRPPHIMHRSNKLSVNQFLPL